MKIISNHTLLANQHILKKEKEYSQTIANTQQNYISIYTKSNFTPTFGERLHRTPENFYAQKFNQDNMPKTVKEYLYKDFSEHHHMPPAQLQREAFEYLKIADTIDDVKSTYPDEPLFQSLRSVNETKPSTGILLLLKWDAQTSNTPIFKDKENKDLTVYLLKKVYLEGKTISEINNDFDNDATEEIKRELGVKDKNYFSNSTFRTLGVKYPNLSYYNSFVATRNDKEYIPPKRKSTVHIITEETKEKLSEASTKWWARLNSEEKAEQIQKMMEGKDLENNIYLKFQGQIMTIAASKMGFSEKLTEIFAEKYANENFKQDFPTFAEQQRAIMLEFWNKDPEFRKNFSNVLQSIISDFEIAYHDKETPEKLETLLSQALELKEKVLNKAKEKRHHREEMKKLATTQPQSQQKEQIQEEKAIVDYKSPKVIEKLFKQRIKESVNYYPIEYQKSVIDYIVKNTDNETKTFFAFDDEKTMKKTLNLSDEEYINKLQKAMLVPCDLIIKHSYTYPLMSKTAEYIVSKYLADITGLNEFLNTLTIVDINSIIENHQNPECFKHTELYNLVNTINKAVNNKSLKQLLLNQKDNFDKQMKTLCRPMKDTQADMILNHIISYKNPEMNIALGKELLSAISNNKKLKTECIKLLQGYSRHFDHVINKENHSLSIDDSPFIKIQNDLINFIRYKTAMKK